MLLRNSISKTKKFFLKTLHNFKSLFSPTYQKLPKKSPHNHFSDSVAAAATAMDLEKFYSDFTEKWDSEIEKKAKRRNKKKHVLSSPQTKQENDQACNESLTSLKDASPAQNKPQMEKTEEHDNQTNYKRSLIRQSKTQQNSSFNSMKGTKRREHRNCRLVENKLRELEMLEMSNVDYVLDIEEVLHYYSRLTSTTYLEIVDKFFMEMYSEFISPARPASPSPPSVKSRLNLRSVRS